MLAVNYPGKPEWREPKDIVSSLKLQAQVAKYINRMQLFRMLPTSLSQRGLLDKGFFFAKYPITL